MPLNLVKFVITLNKNVHPALVNVDNDGTLRLWDKQRR